MDNTLLVKILLSALLFMVVIFTFAAIAYKRLIEEKNENSIFITNKKNASIKKWYSVYSFCSEFPLTRKFLKKLRLQYDILLPGDSAQASEKAIKMAVTIWSIGITLLLFTLLTNPSLFTLVCVCTLIWIVSNQFVIRSVTKFDTKILIDFNQFLDEVRHGFIDHGMVDEAIYEKLDRATPLIQLHALKMYNIFTSETIDDDVIAYNDSVPNHFLKTFVAVCIQVIQHGDKKIEKRSLFLMNVDRIKQEIDIELLKRSSLAHAFSGLIPIAVLPIFSLGIIKDWGISNLPELENFYAGTFGTIVSIGLFIITLISYTIVNNLREVLSPDMIAHPLLQWFSKLKPVSQLLDIRLNHYYGKTLQMKDLLRKTGNSLTPKLFLLQRILLSIAVFCSSIFISFSIHTENKQNAIQNVGSLVNTTSGATESATLTMMYLTKYYTNVLKKVDLLELHNKSAKEPKKKLNKSVIESLKLQIIVEMKEKGIQISDKEAIVVAQQYGKHKKTTKLGFNYVADLKPEFLLKSQDERLSSIVLTARKQADLAQISDALKIPALYVEVASSVLKRVQTFQNEYFHWYELPVAALFSIFAYFAPYILLLYRKKTLQMVMEDEVIQFQSIIMMLMHITNMSIETILECMETFAVIFRGSIQKCINDLPLGEEEALTALAEEEPFLPFKKLVDNLKSCDKIGIQQAFSAIEVERATFQADREQTNKIHVADRSAVAQLFAFVPLYGVIGGYLILPFCLEALRQFMTYTTVMSTM